MVLNATVRLVVGAGKFDHLTPILRDVLHWLAVLQRIQFKVSLASDCVRGFGATYFRDVWIPVAFRSVQRGDTCLCHAKTRTQLGRRSFHVAAPVVWNALPVYPRSPAHQHPSVEENSELELFNQAYDTL